LGLDVDYDFSPALWEKVVYAGAQSASFEQAARDLSKLAEVDISDQRVRRGTIRIGNERVEEREKQTAAYQALSLPQQQASPVPLVPQVAVAEMDGGRLQIRERAEEPAESASDGFWREMKVGCLLSMTSEASAVDPCPELPSAFADPARVAQIAREIKGVSSPETVAEERDESPPAASAARPGQPEPLARSVVATRTGVEEFGPMLAAAAWQRGFAAAERKAFVADGAEANWGVWRKFFSDYQPILDFVHALCYVYAAALAGRSAEEGWALYRDWAQWVWSGEVARVIAALEQRLAELGPADAGESETSPRSQVAKSLGYLRNQRERMRYDEYRRQGLPITSSAVESTVKQINRRMKGTEKFWSVGAEALLTLVADHLSDTPTLAHFWRHRHQHLTGTRCHQNAA
jgi:hypothetical protein